jgi:hypothetical protein
VQLLVNGPPQVKPGQEFVLSLRFSGDVLQSTNANIELSYDPAVLALAGSAAAGDGRAQVNVVNQGIGGVEPRPAEVRFRVLAKERTSSEIGIQVGSAVDFNGQPVRVVAPPAHNVDIVP